MQQIRITHPFSLLTMSLVAVSAKPAEYTECQAPANAYYVKYTGTVSTHKCYNGLQDAVDSVKENETAEIVFLKDITDWAGAVTISNRNITLNLNEHKVVNFTTGSLTAKGATVTIKNGTFNAANNRLVVDASEAATTLTIADDVTVTDGYQQDSVIYVTSAAKKTVLNLNGTWNIGNEMVNCAQKAEEKLTVNLNAKVTGNVVPDGALVVLDAGNTEVNVNGGSYTSNEMVFELQNGTLNINGGTMVSKNDAVVWVYAEPGEDLTQVLNINGGTLTAKKGYALQFNAKNGTYKITKGSFESGKDTEDEQLPAILVTNVKGFLDKHANMITGGSFAGSIVGDVEDKDGRHVDAADAAKILVGNATVKE